MTSLGCTIPELWSNGFGRTRCCEVMEPGIKSLDGKITSGLKCCGADSLPGNHLIPPLPDHSRLAACIGFRLLRQVEMAKKAALRG